MNRDVVDRWCERGILGLVLAILIYGPLALGGVRTPDFLVIELLAMGVMLLWGVRLWLSSRPKLLWPPICWVVIAFATYAVLRYLTADIEYVARLEMIRVLTYAFLFLAILNNLHRQEHTQLIVFTLVFLAMAIAFYAICQFLTDSNKVWTFVKPDTYAHRASGTYISPNNLAGFLEMILPLGLAWMLVSRAKPLMKVFLGYASFVILAGIGVTVSRGSWISVALMLVAFFWLLFHHRAYRLPSAVLLVVIVGIGVYFIPRTQFFQDRLKQLMANERINDSARFELWRPAVELWRQNPWWGIGPDHFNYRFRAFRPQSEQREPDRVHNDYLNTLTDYGVTGLAIVLTALALLWAGVVKTWRYVRGSPSDLGGRKSNKFALVLGASMGMLAILIHSAVDFNMHIPANAILAITLMAMLTGCLRFATEKHWVNVRLSGKTALTLVLAAGMGYFGWQSSRRAAEYAWLERAAKAPRYSPEQVSFLEKAFAVEPMNFKTAYAIGEAFRARSWEGGLDNYVELAGKAMAWFDRAIKLDPYDGDGYLRYGMCLDWLDKSSKAQPYYDRAAQLDPNGYYTAANVGWHYVQAGDYAAARTWFVRSLRLQSQDNTIAQSYLKIANEWLLQAAAKQSSPLRLPR